MYLPFEQYLTNFIKQYIFRLKSHGKRCNADALFVKVASDPWNKNLPVTDSFCTLKNK